MRKSFALRIAVFILVLVLAGWGFDLLSGRLIASHWNFEDSWVVEMPGVKDVIFDEQEEIQGFNVWKTGAAACAEDLMGSKEDRQGGAMLNTARVGDINMAWREKGKGFPLLMISGFGTTMDIWERSVIDRLAEKYRVIVFDNRGMGGTSVGEKEFTISRFAEDARGLLGALGISKSHVLGWSMGSLIAQELALSYPECIGKLVLYASYADWSFPPSPKVIEKLSDPSGTSEERGMRWIEMLFPPGWLAENGQRVEEVFSRPLGEIPGESLARQQQAIENWGGTAERLGALKAQTFLLCGNEDVLVPPENSRKMSELIPDVTISIMPGTGHGLMFQEPDLFVSGVMNFLGKK